MKRKFKYEDKIQTRYFIIDISNQTHFNTKKLIEKSRECHNQKPQQMSDTKRKRKSTEIDTGKINK